MDSNRIVRFSQSNDLPARWGDYGVVTAAGDQRPGVRYLPLLRYYRGMIAAVVLGALAVALVLFKLDQPLYRSRAVIELQGLNENFMNLKELDPTSKPAQSTESFLDTQVRLVSSESLAGRVVKVLDLENNPELFAQPGWMEKIRRAAGLHQQDPPSGDRAVKAVLDALKVRPEGQSALISLTVDSPSPKLSADIANAFAREYINDSEEVRLDATQRTATWLRPQLDALRLKLQNSEDELQAYARQAGIVFTDNQTDVAQDKLRQVQAELLRARFDRAEKQAQLELAMISPPDSLPKVLDDGSLRDYKGRIADLRRQLAELSSTLTPEHYKVKRVQAQISELEGTIARERNQLVNRIRNDYDAANRREKFLAADYANQVKKVSDQAAMSVRYNMLKQDVETTRELYQSMQRKLKEATIAAALRGGNARVVDPAKPSSRPYKPRLAVNLGVGLAGGVLLSLLLVVVRERNNRSPKIPGQILESANLPELGAIPSADAHTGRAVLALRTMPAGTILGRHTAGALLDWNQNSPMAESFRAIVNSILFTGRNGSAPRVIVVSSANPGAGKTLAVTNLGAGIAEVNRRVLLIDGDLRRPGLHHSFAVAREPGLADILRDPRPLAELPVASMIHPTSVPGLRLLSAGSKGPDVVRLLHTDRIVQLLAQLRHDYDVVLIDSPPVLPLSDARVLGRLADGVVLVCRAGRTQVDELLSAAHRLSDDGTTILGTVLNDWNPKSVSSAYYGGYEDYFARGA